MNKTKTRVPEPELSPMASRVSLLTLSLAGAGLPEALERLADRAGVEVDRFTDAPMVKTGELDTLLGDRAPAIREVLDDPGVLTEAEAAAAMGIGVEVVVGLAQRRGVPTMGGSEVLVSKRLWANLCRLVSEERGQFDGQMLHYDGIDWLLRYNAVTEALENATPGFTWADPFYAPKKPVTRVLRAFEAALQAVQGPPRPAREPTARFDEDEEYRVIADRIGVRYKTDGKISARRSAFLGWDLFRLCGFPPSDPAAPGRERARGEAYERLTRDSYAAVFGDTEREERAAVRAALEERIRRPELVSV